MEENFRLINEYYHLHDDELKVALYPFLEMASTLTGAEEAFVSIFDDKNQYFASSKGFESGPVSKNGSICDITLSEGKMVVIEDIGADHRVSSQYDPYGFYAGIPIRNKFGEILGTYCVLGKKPRKMLDNERQLMLLFSKQLIGFLERRKDLISIYQLVTGSDQVISDELKKIKEAKQRLTHDFAGPIGNLKNVTETALSSTEYTIEEYLRLFNIMEGTSDHVLNLLKQLREELFEETNESDGHELLDTASLISEVVQINNFKDSYGDFEFKISELPKLRAKRGDITVIFQNLIENSLKYNNSEKKSIKISAKKEEEGYSFSVCDNGIGIQDGDLVDIFSNGYRASNTAHIPGTGFGLWNVKRILEKYGQSIWADSSKEGTTISFSWFGKSE